MEIWSLMNGKGGVGKTTIATNVAHALKILGYKVCLVDTDPQASVREWQDTADWEEFPVIGMDTKQSLKMLVSTLGATSYDYVIVDTPGRIQDIIGVTIAISNKILIPVQPSPYDIWATADIVRMVQTRQDMNNGSPAAAFILSRLIKNTTLGKEIGAALAEYEFPALHSHITQRVGYAHSAAQGQTVFSTNQKDASDEIMKLTHSIIALPVIKPTEVGEIDVFA